MMLNTRALTFEEALRTWYDVTVDSAEPYWEPLVSYRYLENESLPWSASDWLHLLQDLPVSDAALKAVRRVFWLVACEKRRNDPLNVLLWLKLWEESHHSRVEYSKYSGKDEYMLCFQYSHIPEYSASEIMEWRDWLRAYPSERVGDLLVFLSQATWVQDIAGHHLDAGSRLDAAFLDTSLESNTLPSLDYAIMVWMAWSIRHRSYVDNRCNYLLWDLVSPEQSEYVLSATAEHPSEGLTCMSVPPDWRVALAGGGHLPDTVSLDTWLAHIDDWTDHPILWAALARVWLHDKEEPVLAMYFQTQNPTAWDFARTTWKYMQELNEPRRPSPPQGFCDQRALRGFEWDLGQTMKQLFESKQLPQPCLPLLFN